MARMKVDPGQVERFARPLAGGLVLLVALIGLIGSAISDPRPHHIPVGVVGPDAAVQKLTGGFESAAPGTFHFVLYPSEDAGRAALDSRSVDGLLLLSPTGPHLVVSGAAGDAVTGVISAALGNAFRAQGTDLKVETVHPFAPGDPHGLILFFVVVAIVITTLMAQVLLGIERGSAGFITRLGVAIAFAALAAPVGMGTASWIAGGFGPGFWQATGIVGLASLALGVVVAGGARLLGAPGIGLAGLVVVLVDLVSSGGPVGSDLLPDFYRWLAPGMPAGQLYSAIRGSLYFSNAGIGEPTLVLLAWLVGGLLLLLLGEIVYRRTQSPATAPVLAS
jgi:hypothetical protein